MTDFGAVSKLSGNENGKHSNLNVMVLSHYVESAFLTVFFSRKFRDSSKISHSHPCVDRRGRSGRDRASRTKVALLRRSHNVKNVVHIVLVSRKIRDSSKISHSHPCVDRRGRNGQDRASPTIPAVVGPFPVAKRVTCGTVLPQQVHISV